MGKIEKGRPKPVFGEDFSSLENLCAQWDGAKEELEGAVLVAAFYGGGDYDGYAEAVFLKDGEWYQASCSHCSCYGLDDFTPTQTNAKAILMQKCWVEYADTIEAAEEWRKLQPRTGA